MWRLPIVLPLLLALIVVVAIIWASLEATGLLAVGGSESCG